MPASSTPAATSGCSHEWWHKFSEKKENEGAPRPRTHEDARGRLLPAPKLDGEDSLEANGKTILENSLITISTESGDGRHSDARRELSGVFHAITSAGGRFKTGQIIDVGAEGLDVYNTMLTAMSADDRLGPTDRPTQAVDTIRA